MKTISYILLCGFLFTLQFSIAQKKKAVLPDSVDIETINPQPIRNILKTNPLIPFWGTIPFTAEYRICYEFITSRNQASELSFSYLGKSPFLSLFENDTSNNAYDVKFVVQGYRFQAMHKFYLSGLLMQMGYSNEYQYAPQRFYLAPHVSYATSKFSNRYYNQHDLYLRGSQFNINLRFGYQVFILKIVALDLFTGLGYKKNWWIERQPANTIRSVAFMDELPGFYNMPVKLTLGFNAGIGF